jgi:hypothetical protein
VAKLKDILQQQRKKNFVGRQKETSFFEQLLKEDEPTTHLIYIWSGRTVQNNIAETIRRLLQRIIGSVYSTRLQLY